MARSRTFVVSRALHRWLGLLVGAVLVLSGLSGTILSFDQELDDWLQPALSGPPPADWRDLRAQRLEQIVNHYAGDDLVGIRFPNQAQGVYEIYRQEHTIDYRDAVSGALLLTRSPFTDPMSFAHNLHTHLLAGEFGEWLLGWIAVAGVALLLFGLVLFWPRRLGWRRAFQRPRSPGRAQWFYWHKTIGFVSVFVLGFSLVTGIGLVFYATAQSLLTTIWGGDEKPQTLTVESGEVEWEKVIASLDAALPESRVTFFYPSMAADAPLRFRAKLPQEWHPNGRSYVVLDRTGKVMQVIDDTQSATGTRATHAIYALHSGRTGSQWLRWFVAISGLLPLVLLSMGLVMWFRRPRGR